MAKSKEEQESESRQFLKDNHLLYRDENGNLHYPPWTQKNGKTVQIIDEMCTCGHRKSEHDDRLGGLSIGHGKCLINGCPCTHFEWKRFITE